MLSSYMFVDFKPLKIKAQKYKKIKLTEKKLLNYCHDASSEYR